MREGREQVNAILTSVDVANQLRKRKCDPNEGYVRKVMCVTSKYTTYKC